MAERQAHRDDLLLLIDDDLLRDAPQLLVVAIAQLGQRHVDRALMVRDHHGGEVGVDVAGRLDLHAGHHLGHGAVVLGQERRLRGRRRAERRRADFRDVFGQGRLLGGVRRQSSCGGDEAGGDRHRTQRKSRAGEKQHRGSLLTHRGRIGCKYQVYQVSSIQSALVAANAAPEEYFTSAYLTGPVFGAQKDILLNGEQLALIGRLAARPDHDENWNFHARFSGQTVFHPNVNASGTPGVSRTTLTFGDFPELHIDFNELVDTGPLSARGASVYGGELGANWRNFLVQGEYYQIGVTQSKLPSVPVPRLGFNGGYVEGSWVLTGEPHPYDAERAAWARPKVDHPFSLADGGIGAWELAARYSAVSLDSNVFPGVSQSLTGGVYGGQQRIGALALSWYPNDWLRFMLQFQYVDVNKLNSAGTVPIGQRARNRPSA